LADEPSTTVDETTEMTTDLMTTEPETTATTAVAGSIIITF